LKILVNLSGQLYYYYYYYYYYNFPKALVVARNAPKKKKRLKLWVTLSSLFLSLDGPKIKNTTPQTNKQKLWLSEMPRT